MAGREEQKRRAFAAHQAHREGMLAAAKIADKCLAGALVAAEIRRVALNEMSLEITTEESHGPASLPESE